MVSGASSRTTFAAVPQDSSIKPRASGVSEHRRRQFRIRLLGLRILDQLERHHRAEAAHVADAGHLLGQCLQPGCASCRRPRAARAHSPSDSITSSTA